MAPQTNPELANIPPDWLQEWTAPSVQMRPLQLIHSFAGANPMEGIMNSEQLQAMQAAHNPVPTGIQQVIDTFKQRGLGGIVTNVSLTDYLHSGHGWVEFGQVLAACREAGLRVWIYDEEGYPSGSAGGLVLAQNREYEALALVYDPQAPEPFYLRPAYEYTHATNNFHRLRRFPNLMDDRAGRAFIETTYAAYDQHAGAEFGCLIEAFFTDEPSLMAVNIGQIPDDARAGVPVVDPPDYSLPALPMVPWVYDLPQRYRTRYGEELLLLRRSLFTGRSQRDREVRLRYWALVGELFRERYFGAIRRWCAARGVAASGHCLREEDLFSKVPLDGSPIANLRQMHIPGMDLLTSAPASVLNDGWLTALLPASAAAFNGTRKVMTEVSDFAHTWDHRPHAGLDAMQATAAWQAAFGVTEFTLYYNLADLPQGEDQAYTDFVGRLNALLRAAQPERNMLLYYPVRDLWAEYLPVAEPLLPETQSPAARRMVASFMHLGQAMVAQQVAFALVDHEVLAEARVENGRLQIGGQSYDTLVLPAGVHLPELPNIADWLLQPGRLIQAASKTKKASAKVAANLSRGMVFDPPTSHLVVGRFSREGHPVFLVVNVGRRAYLGRVKVGGGSQWQLWNPANGQISTVHVDGEDFEFKLPSYQAMLVVGNN